VVRSKFGTSLTRVEKGPADFATDADLEAEQAIRDILRAARPDDAIVGEEPARVRPAFSTPAP